MELFDNHNHSQFSFDGKKTTIEKSSRSAFGKGLAGICFTDHCDFYVPPMKARYENLVPEVFDVVAQQAEIDRVNAEFAHEGIRTADGTCFKILKGIEIGVQKNCRGQIRRHLASFRFDQVIASVHYLDDTDPFYGGYYEDKEWKYAYGHYLETLYEEMLWLGKDFDIMGHYDYVARYAPYPQASIFYRDFSDIFDAMFKYLAQEGKALEINTKTYKDYHGRTPEMDIAVLRRFRELGGEAVSLGSDSHDAQRTGDNFLHFADVVRSAGFRYLAHFESRQLRMTPLSC